MHGARINCKWICKVHYINDSINAWCAHTGQTAHDLGTSSHQLGTSKYALGTSKFDLGTSKFDLGTSKYDLGTSVYASSEHLSNTKMKCPSCSKIVFAPKTWSFQKPAVSCTKSQGGCGKVFRVSDTAKSRGKYLVMPEQRAAKQQKLRDFS